MYSSIKKPQCKCGCGKPPTTSYAGYNFACATEEVILRIKSKRIASKKKSDAKKRDAGKVRKLAVKTTFKKSIKRKPIPKMSKKRYEDLKIYAVLRKDFLRDNSTCKCGRNGCKRKATEIHHLRGRIGGLLNEIKWWIPVARICHKWIEEHPSESKQLGLSLSRLNK